MAILTNQPLYPARLDLSHPALAGSSAQIVCFGDANGFLRNAGGLIAQPTPAGTLASGTTDIGSALKFDGSTTYADFGTANIPTNEFTVMWGGVFDALSGVTGIVDCSNGTSNGWSLFTSSTDMYLSGNHYAGDLLSSGWATGTFYHGAARNKSGVGTSIFRNGAKIASSGTALSGVSNPTNPFLVGQLRVSSPRFITARFSYFYLFDKYLSDDLIISLQANPWQVLEEEPEILFYPPPPVGGTTYNQSVAGSLTPTGAIIRLTGKAVSGSSTATGAVTKQTDKAVGGSSTFSGVLSKLTYKGITGFLAGAGSLVKQTAKSYTGSITPTGDTSTTIVFTQPLAGSLTLAGAIGKMTLKTVTGSSTVSGAIAKLTDKGLSASITVQGTINRITARALAGAITATGALSESYTVVKSLAGSITPTGALTAVYIAFVVGVLKLLTMMGIGQ